MDISTFEQVGGILVATMGGLVLTAATLLAVALGGAGRTVRAELPPQDLLLVLTEGAAADSVLDAVTAAGGTVTDRADEIGLLGVHTDQPAAFLRAMAGRGDVLSVGPALMATLDQPVAFDDATQNAASATDYSRLAAQQWGVQAVTHSGAAWQVTAGSHDVVVGLVDTGVDIHHPDLAPNIMPGSRTFVPGTLSAADDGGHGTHVAGIIAANGYLKGVAPGVGIRAYKAVDGHGQANALWVARAIVAAADDGVDVINLSLGFVGAHGQWFYTDPDTGERVRLGNDTPELVAMQRAVRYAVRHGATVVAAAHNWSQDISKRAALTDWYNTQVDWGFQAVGAAVEAPCTMPGVLCVSATGGGWGTPDRPAYYTNYGAAIDLTAPGGDLGPTFAPYTEPNYYKYLIISTVPMYPTPFFHGVTRYGYAAGTSMAVPHVSGAAALYIAQQYALTGSKPSPAQVTARLLQTAAPLGKNGADPYFGQGLVDAYAALTAR